MIFVKSKKLNLRNPFKGTVYIISKLLKLVKYFPSCVWNNPAFLNLLDFLSESLFTVNRKKKFRRRTWNTTNFTISGKQHCSYLHYAWYSDWALNFWATTIFHDHVPQSTI